MSIPNYTHTRNTLFALSNEKNEKLAKKARDYFSDGVTVSKIDNFIIDSSRDEQWAAQYSDTLKLSEDTKIKKYDAEQIKAQYAIMAPELSKDEVETKVASFATTGSDTSGSNVAMDPIIPTNILEVDNFLFKNDGGVLQEIRYLDGKADNQIPEFDILPTPSSVAEYQETSLVNFKRRDGEDYKLNPNIKIQIATAINELALLKGSANYFAELKGLMIQEMQNEMVRKIFQDNDSTNQFHGVLQSRTPANAYNKRGGFNVTTNSDITAITGAGAPFRKLVAMLGLLANNTKTMKGYKWYMSRSTFYLKVVTSMDLQNRYYLDSIMQSDVNLIGPGGLPIVIVSEDCMPSGTVGLFDMSNYFVTMLDGISLKDDGGVSSFLQGQTLVKAYVYADGGYRRNFMRKTDWTTGADDNSGKNAWRFITGI
jgi:hypothetical protein